MNRVVDEWMWLKICIFTEANTAESFKWRLIVLMNGKIIHWMTRSQELQCIRLD